MTVMPAYLPPVRPMTVAEYTALPEDGEIHYELQEGVLVPIPNPFPEHQVGIGELYYQLRNQLPDHLAVVPDVDIDLQIVPPDRPGFVRRPDLVVVTRAGLDRRRREGRLLRAIEVVLAIEIASRGSQRTDHVIKHGEYADAGIRHYWIVDLDAGPSLVACHLGGEFGYVDASPVTGRFSTELPFPLRLDLDGLGAVARPANRPNGHDGNVQMSTV